MRPASQQGVYRFENRHQVADGGLTDLGAASAGQLRRYENRLADFAAVHHACVVFTQDGVIAVVPRV
jgi:hypothetical protein